MPFRPSTEIKTAESETARVLSPDAQSVIASMSASLRNAGQSWGEKSKQYRELREMVQREIEHLEKDLPTDELSQLLDKLILEAH